MSCDSVYSHKGFADHLGGISYPLLADFWPHGEICKRYDAFNEERGLPRRVLYLIDREGTIRYAELYSGTLPDNEKLLQELGKMD